MTMSYQRDTQNMSFNSDTRSSRFRDGSPSVSSFSVEILYIEALPYFKVTYLVLASSQYLLNKGVVLVLRLRYVTGYANLLLNL